MTGVLTEASIASAVTRLALAEGAEVLLTSPVCRAHRLTARVAPRLGVQAEVLELDVQLEDDLAALPGALRAAGWDRVDGVLHAIAYLPDADRSAGFAAEPWSVVADTFQTAAWSLAAVAHAVRPLLPRGASVVGLTQDASRTWEGQDWLGVAQAALAGTARYLARELGPDGVRVNLVATGPHPTMLRRALGDPPWDERAPLGWDPSSGDAVARAVVALMSDWFPATTGEVVHVDGGVHALG